MKFTEYRIKVKPSNKCKNFFFLAFYATPPSAGPPLESGSPRISPNLLDGHTSNISLGVIYPQESNECFPKTSSGQKKSLKNYVE